MTTITVANPNNAKKHVVASFGDLDMANCIESTIILWKISRLAASDGADDDTNDCVLMEFDIHHQVEKAGTVVEYPT
ncbi:MAG: hypothetical protein A2Y61_02570 [Chloroflexi bacterium RBG_13_60_13]|nr:MAG: hypothetical protein A2Y61_02570 [Chloroflexi bacterium RBG_13_60_13]